MHEQIPTENERNHLFPVFIKIENLNVLLIGGGNVALEKLRALMENAPKTQVYVVAKKLHEGMRQYAQQYSQITLSEKQFEEEDVSGKHLVIVAINEPETGRYIKEVANRKNLLVNVADQPDLCDFYLGSIVQKGNLKIAISTNGKSPTIAKRLKETFQELLPDTINDLLSHMQKIRAKLKGDFAYKVEKLNELTKELSQIGNTIE